MISGNPLFQKEVINQKAKSFEALCMTKKRATCYPEIHWWQFPLGGFSIKLEPKYKEVFFGKIYEERKKGGKLSKFLNEKSQLYSKDWNFKKQRLLLYAYKKQTKFVPAWVVFWAARYLGFNLLEIEKNIESYVTFRGRLVVCTPKLPVKMTPEFTAIAIHTMCDGCNYLDSIMYWQTDKREQERFSKLATNVFGTYRVKNNKYCEVLPKIFARIISEYYKITNYSTFEARIPDKIKREPSQHRLAALVAFILDEGSVGLGITLHSSNRLLLSDIQDIAKSLGYVCNPMQKRKSQKSSNLAFKFRISSKSIRKLHRDLLALYEKFPGLNFNKKMDRISKIYCIQNRKWKQREKGETRRIIVCELKNAKKTAFELSESTGICLKTVYYHLKRIHNLSRIQDGNQIYYSI